MENDFTSLKKGIKRNNKLTNLIIYILQRKENLKKCIVTN